MGTNYLLDTNAVLDFLGNKLSNNARVILSQIIDEEINLSAINKIELLGFSRIEQELIEFVSFANVYSITDEIVEKTIEIRRVYKIKLPDAIIAATAVYHKFTLITNNIKDFKDLKELKTLCPNNL